MIRQGERTMLDAPPKRLLDEIIVLCEMAAATYRTSSHQTADHELATLFTTLATARGQMAAGLRALSPSAPKPLPSSSGRPLLTRLKAAFAGDQRRTLIDDCERSDATLARRLADTADGVWPAQLGDTLRRFRSEVTAALGLLAAARIRLM